MILESNYKFSDKRKINAAYIITMVNNDISIELARRCMNSCQKKDQPASMWAAFDGTDGSVKVPKAFQRQDWVGWIKVPNNNYSSTQIACFFSHVSLWAMCARIDEPIIILEHDAICLKKLEFHKFYNCIQYLGSKEQRDGATMLSIPPHASIYDGKWRSLCRAHAYAIDPPMARNLMSYVTTEGMTKTLDMFIRADIFPIVQDGLFFYDEPGISTISEPKETFKDS